jgi:hypothetical protein
MMHLIEGAKLKIAGKVLWDAAKKSLDVGRNLVNLLLSGGIKALMPKGLGQVQSAHVLEKR